MNIIELKFKGTLSRLAGNDFGREIYENQVENKIDFSNKNIIKFPENIEDIAISFVQGFIINILDKIKIEDFNKVIIIEGNAKVVKKFNKSVYF